MADRTLNWASKHVNTKVVRANVTVKDTEGDSHGKDIDCSSDAVLSAAAALEAAVCAELGATIIEPPKPAEEEKPAEPAAQA